MYKSRSIDREWLNTWFGKSFAASEGKNVGIKQWTTIEEFDYIDATFDDATGVNLILKPRLFSVLDLDDEESVIKVRAYLQSEEIPYLEQATTRGYHIYFKYDKYLGAGDAKYMLCNLQTDVKNKKNKNMNLAIKTKGVWREWTYWGETSTEVVEDLSEMLYELPDILRITPKKLIPFNNTEVVSGARSGKLFIYSKKISVYLSHVFGPDFIARAHKVISDYNKYFVDGLSEYELKTTILSQLKGYSGGIIEERKDKLLKRHLYQTFLQVGVPESEVANKLTAIEDYINNLETYMVAHLTTPIVENVRRYNTFYDVRNNIFQKGQENRLFLDLAKSIGVKIPVNGEDLGELEDEILEDLGDKGQMILDIHELLLEKPKYRNIKLERLLQHLAPEFYHIEKLPQTMNLGIKTGADSISEKVNELNIRERMENMRDMGYVEEDIDFDELIDKLKDVYFRKMSGQWLTDEDKEILSDWEM